MLKIFVIFYVFGSGHLACAAADKRMATRKPASKECNDALSRADSSLIGPIDAQIKIIQDAIAACTTDSSKETFTVFSRACGDIESKKIGTEGRAAVRACWLRAAEYVHAIEDVQDLE